MITVFGSINLDTILKIQNFPNAGETIYGSRPQYVPGGKGANQAFSAAGGNVPVAMVGAVGRDEAASLATARMRARGVNLSYVQISEDAPSSQAFVNIDAKGENTIIVADGANNSLQAALVPDALLAETKFLLIQMEVPTAENLKILKRAREFSVTTICTPAPINREVEILLPYVDILAPNWGEITAMAEMFGGGKSVTEYIRELTQTMGIQVLLTKGGEGAEFHQAGAVKTIDAEPIDPVDTTGAGDSFVGAFAAALAEIDDIDRALAMASKSAAETCMHTGAQFLIDQN